MLCAATRRFARVGELKLAQETKLLEARTYVEAALVLEAKLIREGMLRWLRRWRLGYLRKCAVDSTIDAITLRAEEFRRGGFAGIQGVAVDTLFALKACKIAVMSWVASCGGIDRWSITRWAVGVRQMVQPLQTAYNAMQNGVPRAAPGL